jgi:polar amino acid transport system substrate-binding protein
MRHCLFSILLVLLAFSAEAQNAAPRQKLIVATKPIEPFVVFDKAGTPSGYSIDLWKAVAQEAGLDFEFRKMDTVPQVMDALVAKEVDVGVAAFSITAKREAIVDFTHPYYKSGLQILVHEQSDNSPWAAFSGLMKVDTFKVIGVLMLALLANSHLLWWLERRRNPESFPEGYVSGVWEATWWSACTLISGGCENKAPLGVFGRVFAVVWMLAGIALVSYVTATLSSTMTVNNLTSDIKGLSDLKSRRVATVDGSTAAAFLSDMTGIIPKLLAANGPAACEALAARKVDAVVFDEPVLRFYRAQHPDAGLQLVGTVFEKQDYGFALQQNSPHRKALNQALLTLAEKGVFEKLDKEWFASVP